ncbi:MAG: ArsR/SmtB family transcription factor [Rhizobiaceae bacterium]
MLTRSISSSAEKAADFLTVLGNAKRLMILHQLLQQEMPVNAIADRVGLSQSALSQHLAKLRDSGLVDTRREKQMIYYSCNSDEVRRTMVMLADMFEMPAQ